MANKITLDMLIRHSACRDYRNKFTEMFPDGTALVTVDLAVRMADVFPWEWAADNLLTGQNTRAWYEARTVNATYNAETAKAQATKFAELFLAQPETTGRDDYLEILNAHSVFTLADMAGTARPDHDGSQGARFLDDLRDSIAEAIKGGCAPDDLHDQSGTLADEAVTNTESRSTYYKWRAFADLGAWEEDIDGLEDIDDLNKASNCALWLIANRLVDLIAEEYEGHCEDTDSDTDVSRETSVTDSDREPDIEAIEREHAYRGRYSDNECCTKCQECDNVIPDDAVDMVNEAHSYSCSLNPDNVEG